MTKLPAFTLSKIKTPTPPTSVHSLPQSPQSPLTPRSTLSAALIHETIETARSLIAKWDAPAAAAATSLFRLRKDSQSYLSAVTALRRAMLSLLSDDDRAASANLLAAHSLLLLAIKRLEKEFYLILSSQRHRLINAAAAAETDDDSPENPDSAEADRSAVDDLKSIANFMIGCGYGKECLKVFCIIRKSVVDERLFRLGIQRPKPSKVQTMGWQALEQRIRAWVESSKPAVRTVFQRERILCDRVFPASDAIRDSSFAQVSREGASNLLSFPELVARWRKPSPEKIFRLLDLHEAMSDLLPEIDSIFASESTSAVRSQAVSAHQKLADAVRAALSGFEAAIQKDSSKTPVAGGGIHRMTLSAMDYLVKIGDYGGAISEILRRGGDGGGEDSPVKWAAERVAWLVLVLLCKLDGKAELYRDVSLSYLFLANNLWYVVGEVRAAAGLRQLLGGEWVAAHAGKAKQYAASYEKTAWGRVLEALPAEIGAEVTPAAAKECFQRFNAAFEEAHRKQRDWVVADRDLRDEIKVSIARNIVPAYREFYDAHVATLSGGQNLELLVRFAPDNLGNYLSDLFLETSDGSSSRSSSSSSSHKLGFPKK